MIPKIIHYCWFGRNEKSKLEKKCIASWKKYCPDYRIIEWNEDNYDIASAPLYVRQAMEAKMWAFATDYIRFHVVNKYGGIYLDTDVQLIKNLDILLNEKAYFGFGCDNRLINSGIGFGAEKGTPILMEFMQIYESLHFYQSDGKMNLTTNIHFEKVIFLRHGLAFNGKEQTLDNTIHVFPSTYFAPYDGRTHIKKIKKETLSIHWYSMSWNPPEIKQAYKALAKRNRFIYYFRIPKRLIMKLVGQNRFKKLKDNREKIKAP